MSTFPATPNVPGTLSAADKGKLDNTLLGGEVQMLVHVPFVPASAGGGSVPSNATANAGAYAVKARTLVDFTKLARSGTTLKGDFHVDGFVGAGADGDVRIFNATDATELGVINYTETVSTRKTIALSSIPTSGVKLIELQMRRNVGPGQSEVETASVVFYLES